MDNISLDEVKKIKGNIDKNNDDISNEEQSLRLLVLVMYAVSISVTPYCMYEILNGITFIDIVLGLSAILLAGGTGLTLGKLNSYYSSYENNKYYRLLNSIGNYQLKGSQENKLDSLYVIFNRIDKSELFNNLYNLGEIKSDDNFKDEFLDELKKAVNFKEENYISDENYLKYFSKDNQYINNKDCIKFIDDIKEEFKQYCQIKESKKELEESVYYNNINRKLEQQLES